MGDIGGDGTKYLSILVKEQTAYQITVDTRPAHLLHVLHIHAVHIVGTTVRQIVCIEHVADVETTHIHTRQTFQKQVAKYMTVDVASR